VPETAIVAVLAWQLDADDDPGAGWWLDQMRGEADRMRFARKAGPVGGGGDPPEVSAAKAEASRPKLPKRRT